MNRSFAFINRVRLIHIVLKKILMDCPVLFIEIAITSFFFFVITADISHIINNSMHKYILGQKIGQGAFGEVFKARVKSNQDQVVAIKIIDELYSQHPIYK